MQHLRNLFFDFDGVLVDSVQVKTDAFHQLYLPYGNDIADAVVEYHRLHGGVSRYEKFRYYHQELLQQPLDEDGVQELAIQFSALVKAAVIAAPEVPGAEDFLRRHQDRFRMWIITGTPTSEILPIGEARGWSAYFEGVHGSPQKKKYWTEFLIREHGLERSETLFLGDATTDLAAAEHSKLNFALRDYAENKAYFTTYDGLRFADFAELEQLLSVVG